jgi:ribosomal protein S18 acetylase RimI-like enzyme
VTARGGLAIRPATAADVPAMRALGVRTWRAAYAAILPPDAIDAGIAEFWNEYSLGAAARSGRMLVAVRDGTLVGLLESDRLDDGRAVVWKLYVTPEAQRHGIGRSLIRAHLARLAADGVAEVWLEHDDANAAAAAFYERLGFAIRRSEDSAHTPGARIVWRARRVRGPV